MTQLAERRISKLGMTGSKPGITLILLYAGARAQGWLSKDAPEIKMYEDQQPHGTSWRSRAIEAMEEHVTEGHFHVLKGKVVFQIVDQRVDLITVLGETQACALIHAIKRDLDPKRKEHHFSKFISRTFEEAEFLRLEGALRH